MSEPIDTTPPDQLAIIDGECVVVGRTIDDQIKSIHDYAPFYFRTKPAMGEAAARRADDAPQD